jgi:hypothetical protein
MVRILIDNWRNKQSGAYVDASSVTRQSRGVIGCRVNGQAGAGQSGLLGLGIMRGYKMAQKAAASPISLANPPKPWKPRFGHPGRLPAIPSHRDPDEDDDDNDDLMTSSDHSSWISSKEGAGFQGLIDE